MIGVGVHGRVYRAHDSLSASKKEYALKIIEFKDYESEIFANLMNEIIILRKLAKKHKNNFYIELFDAYIISDPNQQFKKLILVEELCECNLNDIINVRKQMGIEWGEEELVGIFSHLLEALEKIQNDGICHRDIKPHNILFSKQQKQFKLGDFGEGKFLTDIDETEELTDTEEIK